MNIYEKLAHIQTELKAPKKLWNKFGGYYYRNAEGILEALKPYLTKYNVTVKVTDSIVLVGERYYVEAIASIYDCEEDKHISVTAYAREAENKKGMDESQITGTASSYARKYALNGLFLLDDTKDADTDEQKIEADARCENEMAEIKKSQGAIAEVLQKEGIKPETIKKLYGKDIRELTEKQIQNISEHIADIKKKQEAQNE